MVPSDARRGSALLALAIVAALAAGLTPASADPAIQDNGNGTRTVVWDFSNPANYTSAGVVLNGDGIELARSSSAWVQSSDADFIANQTWGFNSVIANDALRLAGNEGSLVGNGDFTGTTNWTYTSGPTNAVEARRNLAAGEFYHSTANNETQYDNMDNVGGWQSVSSAGAISLIGRDTNVKVEGGASLRDTITLPDPSFWAGMSNSAFWDFSGHNRLSVWLNTTHSGPETLSAVLHLESGLARWDSGVVSLTTSWRRVEFDFTPFGANLTTISRLDLRFTGAVVAAVDVFADDIRLIYRKTVTETASIAQSITKPTTGPGLPGGVLLNWVESVPAFTAPVATQFEVALEDSSATRSTWSWSITETSGATPRLLDLSVPMAAADTYNLTFSLHVSIDTHLATAVTLRVDDVVLTAPDYANGAYMSRPLDAGSPAIWGTLRWTATTDPETGVTVETRSGSSLPAGNPTWTTWLLHSDAGGEPVGSRDDRYLQFRVSLWTLNSSRTPVLHDLTIEFSKYVLDGHAEAVAPFDPPEPLVGWRSLNASFAKPAETEIRFEVSSNGVFWTPVVPGSDLSWYTQPDIRIRTWLTTTNSSLSPGANWMSVTYEFVGPLWSAQISPTDWVGTADESATFTVAGFDAWGHPVAFPPEWETTDPGGSVVGGVYTPHTAGSWVVRVRAPTGVLLANATVTVSAGVLARIDLAPPFSSAPAGSTVAFTLLGFDAKDNGAGLSATQWSATAGSFTEQTPSFASLLLPGTPGPVTVTARHGTLVDTALVNVTSDGTPVISDVVPDQIRNEDDSWSLNLTVYASNQPDRYDSLANLSWSLEGKDRSLCTVWGEGYRGNHVLVFRGMPDAFGSDDAILWLEDATGARTSQSLAITLRPVNDAPRFVSVPDLPVKAGDPYPFDASPYIVDVDDPPAGLTLSADDPAHVAVSGLNLTLTYPTEDLGRRIFLRLTVSDGEAEAQTVVIVEVTSNTPPHVAIPLPDLTLLEDETRLRAFPRSLSEYFGDRDGDDLFFSYGYRNVQVTITDNAGFWQVDIQPNRDWHGVEHVTFRAEDSLGAFAEYTVRVSVASVNDPPTLSWRDDVRVRFDTPYPLELAAYVADVDNPLEDVTLEASPSLFASVDGFRLTLFYPRYALGPNPSYAVPLWLYVNDTEPGESWRIYVHVSNNTPPVLTRPLPDVAFDEDTTLSPYRLLDYFADLDGGTLTFTARGSNIRIDIAGDSQVTFRTVDPDWFGQELVEFRAEDPGRAFAIATVTVRVDPVNDAPRFTQPFPDLDLSGGGVRVIDLRQYVSDVDDDVSSLAFVEDGTHATVVGYILVLEYPATASSERVQVTVSDGRLSETASFRVTLFQPSIWAQIGWPWSGVAIATLAVATILAWAVFLRYPHTLEDVFIVGSEGRLIMHNTRRLRADRDEDILAGMLTAIMLFVRDSFKEEHEDLKQFEFGDRRVLVERGERVYVAAIYAGTPPPWARKDLTGFLRDIEAQAGDRLASWSGDKDDVRELKGLTEAFVRSRRYSVPWRAGNHRARAS